ncbi:MAG TPA: hypothetical protein PKC30_07390 [Saprospiraceae bacterium]|nr:hypothetical protein [Saprospiraceae bacterium]
MKQFNLTFTLSVLVITVFTTETITQVTTRVLGDDLGETMQVQGTGK